MAKLQFLDGTHTHTLSQIQEALKPLGVSLRAWPVNADVQELLNKASLQDHEKESVAAAHDHYFETLKESDDYQSRDLIVLHPDIPQLDTLLAKFQRIHTHDDDEVRYIVDGEGIFGFVLSDTQQILLTVEAGEYINVPKNTEHWFILTPTKRIKALRYFTTTEGWAPVYTDRPILF